MLTLAERLSPHRLLQLSIGAALLTIALKAGAWFVTGSVGLLSDAMESFVNLASAVFALAMVTLAQQPADKEHPYGHTKAEYFSSGFEGILIFGAAAAIGWTAVERLLHPQALERPGLGMALSVLSAAINGLLALAMLRASRQQKEKGVHGAEAVEADARHLMTDVYTTAGVLIGVSLVFVTGWLWLDPVIAILVALNILREALHLMQRATDGLMDHALEPELQKRIQTVLGDFTDPDRPDLLRFDHITTRRAGQRRFVDMHMHMPPNWTLRRAAAVRTSVEQALMSEIPGLRATIQLLPGDVEAHFHDDADLK